MTKVIGLDNLLRDIGKFEVNVERMAFDCVNEAALVIKTTVLAGSPSRLSGVGKKGAKLNVRYDIKGAKNPTALVRATGPWPLIERDTKPHDIPKARGKRGQVRPLLIGDQWVEGPVHHPGTKGQHPFAKGVEKSLPLVHKIFEKQFSSTVRKSFGGS